MQDTPLVEMVNIKKYFGRVQALNGVSVSVLTMSESKRVSCTSYPMDLSAWVGCIKNQADQDPGL